VVVKRIFGVFIKLNLNLKDKSLETPQLFIPPNVGNNLKTKRK